MKDKEYILFDLDGTLTDSGPGITNSVAYALNKFGISVPDTTVLRTFVGPPLKDSFMKYYGFTEEQAMQGILYYREYYLDKGIYENSVYKGIEELLSALVGKGKKLMIATSKPETAARIVLNHFNLTQYFDLITGATEDDKVVEKADVMALAVRNMPICDLSAAVMVGDREHDVFGSKQTGMECIGVLYGYGSLEELQKAGADVITESTQTLGNLLL